MYETLVFISDSELAALDINDCGETEFISINGNERCKYTTVRDIEQFCNYLKEYYNIESFDDIELFTTLINFEASKEKVDFLYNLFKKAKGVNTIDAKLFLPYLVMGKGKMNKADAYTVKIFEKWYQIVNKDNVIMCKLGTEDKNYKSIALDEFISLIRPGCDIMFNNVELEEKNRKLEEKVKELEREITKINNSLIVSAKEGEEAKEKANDYRNKYEDLLSRRDVDEKRLICRFRLKEVEYTTKLTPQNIFFRKYIKEHEDVNILEQIGGKFTFHTECRDGDYVKKGDIIANFQHESVLLFNMRAEKDGRFFQLKKDGEVIVEGETFGLIGPNSDNKIDIMEWYSRNL